MNLETKNRRQIMSDSAQKNLLAYLTKKDKANTESFSDRKKSRRI